MNQLTCSQKTYDFLTRPLRGKTKTILALIWAERLLVAFTAVGYLLTCLQAFLWGDFQALRLLSVVACPATCLLVTTLLQKLIKRKRPYQTGREALVEKKSVDNSCPSRHTACAFVIATTAMPYAGALGTVLLGVSVLISFFRFLFGHHHFTDLLFGIALGVAFGVLGWIF